MKRIAIVGAGIAGLGCAHYLHPRHDITLFEAAGYAGGHTNTIDVTADGALHRVDTGFMVYNTVTYPLLTRLMEELGVMAQPTDMSFSLQHKATGLEWSGAAWYRLFGQRRNLLNLRFWRFLRQLGRFNDEAPDILDRNACEGMTMREYVATHGYGDDFMQFYLIPMSAAVWSGTPEQMLDFPARTLLWFFRNHGFLGMDTQYDWLTIAGGAQTYVEKLTAPFTDRIRLNSPIQKVVRDGEGVTLYTAEGQGERFDEVILACHADTAYRMLDAPDALETEMLPRFRYQHNIATVHTDARVMPKSKGCWAAWNYRVRQGEDGWPIAATHYWMNLLQSIKTSQQIFVTINDPAGIAPETVQRTIDYTHPVFSLDAIAVQHRLQELNLRSDNRVFFCGSYFRYGFHEDALRSAVDLCRAITTDIITI